MKFSHFPLSKYIVSIITCCILLYSLNSYCQGLRTFRWLNQFSTYRGGPNPCGGKVLASYISKAPWRETPTILSFFDNFHHYLKYAVFLRITHLYLVVKFLLTKAFLVGEIGPKMAPIWKKSTKHISVKAPQTSCTPLNKNLHGKIKPNWKRNFRQFSTSNRPWTGVLSIQHWYNHHHCVILNYRYYFHN